MGTSLGENVDQETIEALTITGKGDFKILPKDQLEAIYANRFLAYSGDILRNKFHIILQDNMGLIYSIKQLKTGLEKITDHLNWAKVEKTVLNNESGGLSSNVSNSSSTANDKSLYLGYTKGDNTANGDQEIKAGATDSNSLADAEKTKQFLEINKDKTKNVYPTMRNLTASNQSDNNVINDIGIQLNNMASNSNGTSVANTTGLSKSTNKSDATKLNFSTAQDLIGIINMKIPELRKIFYSKFESLFIAIY